MTDRKPPNKAVDPTVRAASLRSAARPAAHRQCVRRAGVVPRRARGRGYLFLRRRHGGDPPPRRRPQRGSVRWRRPRGALGPLAPRQQIPDRRRRIAPVPGSFSFRLAPPGSPTTLRPTMYSLGFEMARPAPAPRWGGR
jgi:hypothetical protein